MARPRQQQPPPESPGPQSEPSSIPQGIPAGISFTTQPQYFGPVYAPAPLIHPQLPHLQPQTFIVPNPHPPAPPPRLLPANTNGHVNAHAPEPQRILHVLDSLKEVGFLSLSDFLNGLFESEDPAVKRRCSSFYMHGGIRELLEIFMKCKRARENGGDELAVHWAGGVLKEEFDSGLVKGGVNVDVRASSTEAKGRSTGEILKDGLETFDLSKVQQQCETKAPLLWKLLETLSSSDRDAKPNPPGNATSPGGTMEKPVTKRRKIETGTNSSGSIPLTVTVLLLLLASSQVRNKFQKWLGLYLYAQGVRKGPLNSLRTLGVGSEGKVIGDNVLRVIGEDTKNKLRIELGGSGQRSGAQRPAARGKRKSVTTVADAPLPAPEGPNPLDGKRQFAVSNITYHLTPKDHLRADNFQPCATIPFIIRLPVECPVLTKGMVKTSSAFRRKTFLQPHLPPPQTNHHHSEPQAGPSHPPHSSHPSHQHHAYYHGYNFGPSSFQTAPGYDAPTPSPQGDFLYMPPIPGGSSGPNWPGGGAQGSSEAETNVQLLLSNDETNLFWKNRKRRSVWRAMKRLWATIDQVLPEHEVDEQLPRQRRSNAQTESRANRFGGVIPAAAEDDLLPLPSMKRVNSKNVEEQLSILDGVADYLGFEVKHLKGPSNDRLWLWGGTLEAIECLKMAKATAPPDSVLHHILPVLQLFDIRQMFLLELLRMHYGIANDKDPASLCHHMTSMNRKFLIFGFNVTGQYAEGLILHSLESHLIASILTVTKIRGPQGPQTKSEALGIIDAVYATYFDPITRQRNTETDSDEVFENHVLFLSHAIVYQTLLESVATASAQSLIHVLSWLSIAFQSLSSASSFARELMDLVVGLKYEYAPPLAAAIMHSLLTPKPTTNPAQPPLSAHPAAPRIPGTHQETDFAMKQILRQTKTVFDLRDNPKHDFFRDVATPNIRTITTVVRHAEEALGTATRTANQWKSPAENVDPDREIPKLVQELREARVAERVKGRKASSIAEDLIRLGEEKMRTLQWMEEFVDGKRREADAHKPPSDVAAAAAVAAVEKKKTGKRNLFFNDDFVFDWGL